MFPAWTADIHETPRGLSFQLFDEAGRVRGRKVSLHHNLAPLERSDLMRLIGDTTPVEP